MSKETIVRCDNPNCRKVGAEELWLTVGRECDAAGSMNDVDRVADVCTACRITILTSLVKRVPQEVVEDYLSDLGYFRKM